MSHLTDKQLAGLLRRYLDIEGLLRDHPEVRRSEIDAFWTRHGLDEGPSAASEPRELFDEAPASGLVLRAHCDGAARGNPGPAAIGVVLRGQDGRVVAQLGERIGRATNNVAEYTAVIRAAEKALELGAAQLLLLLDSELLVRQLQGSYKVKAPHLRPLHQRACRLLGRLGHWQARHVPRGQNAAADALANRALDLG